METILIFLTIIISVLAIYIAYQDVVTRKVKNTSMLVFFLLSILYFLFSYPHAPISYLVLTSLILISFLLYSTNIWGAADGKFFIASSIIVLSLGDALHFFEYLFNMLFIFAIASITIGFIVMKPKKKYSLIKFIPYKLHLFQSLIILAITTYLYTFLTTLIEEFYVVISLIIAIILVINSISKKLFYRIEQNSTIVIGFMSFSLAFYQLLQYFPQALIALMIIKAVLFYTNQIAMKGMDTKKYGFAPPIVTYMAFALMIQLIINQTILLYIVNLF